MLKVLYSEHNNTLIQTNRTANDHCPGAPERGTRAALRKRWRTFRLLSEWLPLTL